MKAKKATGALVVSLILAFVMLGIQLGTVLTLGIQMKNIANPKTDYEEEVAAPELDDMSDWIGDVEIEAPLHDSEVIVNMDVSYEDNECSAVISGLLPDGSTWDYYTDVYEMTELEPISEIHCFKDQYIFCAGGAVYALDTYTGQELWVNYDFGGYSPVCCLEEDVFCLSGYYGPDVFVVDGNGNTLAREEQLHPDYYWPLSIYKVNDTQVEITYEGFPAGAGSTLVYDFETGTTGEAQQPQSNVEMQDSGKWMEIYRQEFASGEMDPYSMFALVRIDADATPELVALAETGFVLYAYNEESNQTFVTNYTSQDMGFYYAPESGMFETTYYHDGTSSCVYYDVTNDGSEKIVALKYVAREDGSYTYYIDGSETSGDEYYRVENEVLQRGFLMYPTFHTEKEILQIMESWYDPSDDEAAWKECYLDNVEYSGYNGYRLLDMDGNGVPELLTYALDDYGEYSCIYFCDPQSRQVMIVYGAAAKDIVYLPNSDLVSITYAYEDAYVDQLYRIGDRSLTQIANGTRLFYDDSITCYCMDENIEYDEYLEIFVTLNDPNAVSVDKNWVSKENMMEKLQN